MSNAANATAKAVNTVNAVNAPSGSIKTPLIIGGGLVLLIIIVLVLMLTTSIRTSRVGRFFGVITGAGSSAVGAATGAVKKGVDFAIVDPTTKATESAADAAAGVTKDAENAKEGANDAAKDAAATAEAKKKEGLKAAKDAAAAAAKAAVESVWPPLGTTAGMRIEKAVELVDATSSLECREKAKAAGYIAFSVSNDDAGEFKQCYGQSIGIDMSTPRALDTSYTGCSDPAMLMATNCADDMETVAAGDIVDMIDTTSVQNESVVEMADTRRIK